MEPIVIVYSLPTCPNCDRTKEMFSTLGIDYREVNLVKDREARDKVTHVWGFSQAPVIDSPIGRWSGFDPTKIKELHDSITAVRD